MRIAFTRKVRSRLQSKVKEGGEIVSTTLRSVGTDSVLGVMGRISSKKNSAGSSTNEGTRPKELIGRKRFHNCIMKLRADLLDRLMRAVGPSAVGEECDRKLTIGIDPERSAGVAEVAVGAWSEIFSGLRRGGGRIPA